LRTITKLEQCPNLVHLCLRQNFITSETLSGLLPISKSIIKLDMYENQIDGKGLSNFLVSDNQIIFPSLKYLDLSFNPIRQLSTITKDDSEVSTESLREGGPLSAFPNLEYLFFVECKITEVPCFKNIPKLHCLELGANRIRDINGVECLPALRELWFGKNKISTIENLNIPHLNLLSLQANRIVKIQGLENLKSLTQLYLSENGIEVIEGLKELTNLTLLDLDKNRISVIQGLDTLTKLEELWLSYNNISSFAEVAKLKTFSTLKNVCFEQNPIFKDPQYRNKILADLLQVSQLDSKDAVRTNNPLLQ